MSFDWFIDNIIWIAIWIGVMSQIRFPKKNTNRKYVKISKNNSKWDNQSSEKKIL